MGLIARFKAAMQKRRDARQEKKRVLTYAKAYGLLDENEQRRIIDEYNKVQERTSTLNFNNRKLIEDKVSFMIRNGIIKVEI